jgi:hypothetical protein
VCVILHPKDVLKAGAAHLVVKVSVWSGFSAELAKSQSLPSHLVCLIYSM